MAPSRIQVQGFPDPPCNLVTFLTILTPLSPDLPDPNANFGLKESHVREAPLSRTHSDLSNTLLLGLTVLFTPIGVTRHHHQLVVHGFVDRERPAVPGIPDPVQ